MIQNWIRTLLIYLIITLQNTRLILHPQATAWPGEIHRGGKPQQAKDYDIA